MDALESLLDKNLVRRATDDGPEARFAMLVSLREYAAERLAEDGEEAATRDRHAAWFATRSRHWEATLGSAAETATLEELPRARADARTALGWVRTHPDPDDALWLATMLGWDGYLRGLMADAVVALDVLAERGTEASGEVRTAATLAAGVVAFGHGRPGASRRAARRGGRGDRPAPGRGGGRLPRPRGARRGPLRRGRGPLPGGPRGRPGGRQPARSGVGRPRPRPARAGRGPRRRRRSRCSPRRSRSSRSSTTPGAAPCAAGCSGSWRSAAVGTTWRRSSSARALRLHRDVGDRRGAAQCLEALAEVALARGSAATAGRLLGAAGRQREVVASPPNEHEARALEDIAHRVERSLGTSAAQHERHAGRTMAPEAVFELAERLTTEADAEAATALTARQSEVAALVAEGLTNRQIGRRLGISEKTVELHVSDVLARLGVPSRAGVAAWAAGRSRVP